MSCQWKTHCWSRHWQQRRLWKLCDWSPKGIVMYSDIRFGLTSQKNSLSEMNQFHGFFFWKLCQYSIENFQNNFHSIDIPTLDFTKFIHSTYEIWFHEKKFTLEFFHRITSLFFNKRHGKSGLLLPHLKEVKLFVKLARLSGKKSNLWENWSVWKWVKLYQRELVKFKNTWIFVIMLLASPGMIFLFHGKKN